MRNFLSTKLPKISKNIKYNILRVESEHDDMHIHKQQLSLRKSDMRNY